MFPIRNPPFNTFLRIKQLENLIVSASENIWKKNVHFLQTSILLISGSWFRASAMTTMNKKPIRSTRVLKSLKLYCILIPHYMFRALLRP
jgi:hypothetical protein